MTFYQQQVLKIKAEIYPSDDLCQQIVRAKLFIDQQFANKITGNDIARKAFLSKYHFIRIFKNMYSRTPHQHLQTVRLEQAKKLLKTNLPINEVCFAVGFESVTSFTGLFKRITGMTPATYRRVQPPIL